MRTKVFLMVAAALALMVPVGAQLSAPQQVQICTDLGKIKPNNSTEKKALDDAKALACIVVPAPAPPLPPPPPAPNPVPPPAPPPVTGRVTSLTHQCSFLVPDVGVYDADKFAYGGQALGWNAANGSIFIAGFNAQPSGGQRIAELKVPACGATASMLQSLTDPSEGKASQVGPNTVLLGGTLPYNGKLYFTEYLYYDGAGQQVLSHFSRPLTLSTSGQVVGPTRAGPLGAGFYSGYMGVIPQAWQMALGGPAFTGNGILGVISRTSFGPSVAAFDPEHMGAAIELVGYPETHTTLGAAGQSNPLFGGADTMRGVVMAEDTSTVIFFGRHGDTYCYGVGTSNQSLAGKPSGNGVDPYCYDPDDGGKGVHGYPYRPYAWLYDANDLASVKSGVKQPWDIKPYATVTLPNMGAQIGGATIDPASGRIFVTEMYGSGSLPVVHIYRVQ